MTSQGLKILARLVAMAVGVLLIMLLVMTCATVALSTSACMYFTRARGLCPPCLKMVVQVTLRMQMEMKKYCIKRRTTASTSSSKDPLPIHQKDSLSLLSGKWTNVNTLPRKPSFLKWTNVSLAFNQDGCLKGMSMPHKLPLVVSPMINNYQLGRVLANGGSSSDLLFISTLDETQIPYSKIKPVTNHFFGILPRPSITPIGQIVFPATLGDSRNF